MQAFKRAFSIYLTVIIAIALAPDLQVRAFSAILIPIKGEYGQTEARSMLSLINSFRTQDDAWYWDSDDETKITVSNLAELKYDYELEKIAMLRAAELAVSYSHLRPNGSKWLTAFSDSACNAHAENIAMGYESVEEVFEAFREDDEDFDDQGHRRHMLSSDAVSVGIGHFIYDGIDYWVQEFSTNVVSVTETDPVDGNTGVEISVRSDGIKHKELYLASTAGVTEDDEIELCYGDPANEITIGEVVKIQPSYVREDTLCNDNGSDYITAMLPLKDIAIVDDSIASLSEGKVIARKKGSTEISAKSTWSEREFSIPVIILPRNISVAEGTTPKESYDETGKAIRPEPRVTDLGKVLQKGTDYSVSYENNVKAGEATIICSGKGNYEGELYIFFQIAGKNEDQGDSGSTNQDGSNDNTVRPASKGTVIKTSLGKYKVTSDNVAEPTVELIKVTTGERNLKIPDVIKDKKGITYKIISIGKSAARGKKNLKSVSMGKNVTSIGKDAFKQCRKLGRISMTTNIKDVGKGAFRSIRSKANITIDGKKSRAKALLKMINTQGGAKDAKLKNKK